MNKMKHWLFKIFRFTDGENKKSLINLDTGAFVCTMLAYLVNYNTLHAGFVYDDNRAIIRNSDIMTSTPVSNIWRNDFWGTPINSSNSHGSYRPLCVITFRLNYWLSEFKPLSYHMINVILHCVSTYLVLTLGRALIPYPAHITAALLFAVHPIHCEAVASIVGRADVLANIFFCSAFLCYIEHVRHRNRCTVMEEEEEEEEGGDEKVASTASGRRPRANSSSCYNTTNHRDSGVVVASGNNPDVTDNSNNKFASTAKVLRYKCCSAEYHTRTYRLGSMLKKLFELLKLGNSCTSEFEGIPRKVSECSEVREWACLFATLALATAAMLSKETGITVLGVCVAYDFIKSKSRLHGKRYRLFRSVSILGCTAFLLLVFRFYIMGDYNRPTFATSDNPVSKSKSLLTRTLTFLYLPVFNFILLLYPMDLNFDWGMDAIPRITSIIDRRNVVSLLFYALGCQLLKRSLEDRFRRLRCNQQNISHRHFEGIYDNCKCYYPIYRQVKQTKRYNNNNNNNGGSAGGYYKKLKNGNNAAITGNSGRLHSQQKTMNGYHHHHHHHHQSRKNNEEEHFPKSKNGFCTTNSRCCSCCCDPRQQRKLSSSSSSYYYSDDSTTAAGQDVLLRYSDLYLLSISLMVLPFLPATNLLFYVGFVVAERILYIPSVGYCFLAAVAFEAFERKTNSKKFRGMIVVLIFLLAVRTVYRNKDWKNEESLYRSGIVLNPPKSYVNLGSILSSEGKLQEAEEVLNLALKYRPNMAEAHYNLGIIKQGTGRIREAINSYEMAIHYRPSMALAHLNLGQLLAKQGQREKAEQVLRRCYALDGTGLKDPRTHHSTRITALVHLGRIQAERGKYRESIATYKEAVRSVPENYEHFRMLYNLLGDSLTQIGQHEEADKWYKLAAEDTPPPPTSRQVESKPKYGKHLAKNKSRIAEPEKLFYKILDVETFVPTTTIDREKIGIYIQNAEAYAKTAENYFKTVDLSPERKELIMNAVSALREAGRTREAEQLYGQVLHLNIEQHHQSNHLNAVVAVHPNDKVEEKNSYEQKETTTTKTNSGNTKIIANLDKLKISLLRKQQIFLMTYTVN